MESQLIYGRWENEILSYETDKIDLIYTDPPYEMNYISNIPGDKRWCKSGETDSRFEKPIQGDGKGNSNTDWSLFFKECFRILKPNSYLVLHCNHLFFAKIHSLIESIGFTYKGMIAWNKRFAIGGDVRGAMKRDWEPIVYYAKEKPRLRTINVLRKNKNGQLELQQRDRISEIADWNFSLTKEEKIGHPTQKPITLAKQMIELMTDKAQIVLDPFAGSGTIPKAADELERKYIGIECDENFYFIMKNRLNYKENSVSMNFEIETNDNIDNKQKKVLD